MTDETPITRTYMRHTVELQPDWTFKAIGPEFDETRYAITFKSFTDACTEIEKRVSDSNKIAASKIQLDILALDDTGNLVKITKINRREGDIECDIYPNVQRVRHALAERNRLVAALKEQNDFLNTVKVKKSRCYRRIEVESYPFHVKELIDAFEKATALAKSENVVELKKEPNS